MLAQLRPYRFVLIAVGSTMTIVGVAGLLAGWGSTSAATPRARPRASATTPTPHTVQEDPAAFFAEFSTAVRSGDTGFLTARLNPAVIARYGSSQCGQFAASLTDPTQQLRLVGVTGPAGYDYASDGLSTTVDGVYTFQVDGTAAGRTGPREYHFALVDGRFRSFVDCGDPVVAK